MPNACHKTKRCQHATIVSNVRWHFLERKTMFNFRPRIPSTLHLRLVNSRMQPVCRNSDYFDSLQEFCLQSGIHPIKNLFDINTYLKKFMILFVLHVPWVFYLAFVDVRSADTHLQPNLYHTLGGNTFISFGLRH